MHMRVCVFSSVAAKCFTDPWRCATTFIGPMGMGASFNKTSWYLKGGVLGTELRAFNNIGWCDRVADWIVALHCVALDQATSGLRRLRWTGTEATPTTRSA